MTDPADASRTHSNRLQRTRSSVRATMVAERLWPLAIPAVLVALFFLSAAWLGIFRMLPDAGRFGLAIFGGVAFLLSLYPLRFFRLPQRAEVDRRIESANRLVHTPVLVQGDRPAASDSDPFSQALWREHQKRMEAKLADLRGDAPRTGVAERDPWGLRAVVVLIAVAAFAFSFGPFGGRLADAFEVPPPPVPVPPRIDAWVTPPAYTGAAPIFLSDANGPRNLSVPEGSVVALQVTGGSGAETLERTAEGDSAPVEPEATAPAAATPAPASKRFTVTLDRAAELALRDGSNKLRRWAFAVTADAAPAIRFTEEPKRAANGTLELAYEVTDDYGATEARSAFALAEEQPADARPLYGPPEMPLALPRRNAKAPTAKASRDLTEHVWAGSTIKLTLTAKDAAGQEGFSEPKEIVLPEKPFTNPLARALVEQRKLLALDANAKPQVLELMDAITLRPEDTIPNASHFLAIESARTRLDMASTDDQLREVADYLWEVALGIEEGDLSDAQKRLNAAQEALKQALENGASDEEIERLMQELRQAMNEFLREFAEQAQKNPNLGQMMPQNGQELRPQDLDRMMDRIEDLAKSGNRDAAQEMLSQLQDMMNNLQAGRQPQQGQQGQQNSEMREQMDKLGELLRQQQELMNETFRQNQRQQGQNGEGQDPFGENQQQQQGQNGQGQQPGDQGPMSPEEFAEAMRQLQQRQGELQKQLEALQKGLEGMGMEPGEGFGDAGREMGEAQGALGEGQGDQAVGNQGRALEALRRGAQSMMQQMMQAMQGEEGGSEQGGRQQNSDRDPLGRPRATTGPDLGNSVEVPDEIDVQRARRILEAIRERLGNALSPELERSYLERLLEMR